MIPLRLELKNFLSYVQPAQVVDFRDHALICLAGKNGHGKSALLDAITWALWGQARKISGVTKPDEGLLALGQTKMMVILDFSFNRQVYRVKREYLATHGRPITNLELFVLAEQQQVFLPLTDKTINATQAKLEQILCIDYDTFISSSFLRQGGANEFSKKSPRERKQLLAKILGLERYQNMQTTAQVTLRSKQQALKGVQLLMDQYAGDLAQEESLSKQLQEQLDRCAQFNQMQQHGQQQVVDLQEQQLGLQGLHQQLLKEQERRLGLQAKLQNVEELLSRAAKQWRQGHAQLLNPDLHLDWTKQQGELNVELEVLANEQKDWWVKRQHLVDLQQQQSAWQQEQRRIFAQQEQELLQSIQQRQWNLTHLQTSAQQALQQQNKNNQALSAVHSRQQALQTQLQQLALLVTDEEKAVQVWERLGRIGQRWVGRQQLLQQRQDALSARLLRIDEQNCQLCQRPVGEQLATQLIAQGQKGLAVIKHQLARLQLWIPRLRQQALAAKQGLELCRQAKINRQLIEQQAEVDQRELVRLQQIGQELMQQLAQQEVDIQQAQMQLLQAQQTLKEKQSSWASEFSKLEQGQPWYVDLQQMSARLPSSLQEAENVARQERLKKQLAVIQQKMLAQASVKGIVERQQLLRERVKDLVAQRKLLKLDMCAEADHGQALSSLQQQLQLLEKLLHEQRIAQSDREQSMANLQRQIGSLQNHLQRIGELKLKQQQHLQQANTLQEEIGDFTLLAQAFGKDGLQALLIEELLPEIEEETNHILGLISNNQAQVVIDSMRDLKKGGFKESLDIKIFDSWGLRPYEMFSGGEAFRIDFALRVALSRILAKRAGCQLQTLIIDEGFGSLDEEGLELMADCLNRIAADFAKIIVVTHLPDFKELFPVHFLVHKSASGSHVQISQRA